MSNSAPRRSLATGTRIIEAAISSGGAPVIGLYLFMAYGRLIRSMGRGSPFAVINPAAIGIPALLMTQPGLSQTELADLMGVGRMTAGAQVAQCIRGGLVRRRRSDVDKRRYELHVTAKGRSNLRRIATLIPLHEQYLFGSLSARERTQVYKALRKLIEATSPSRVE
jgi:DNA-binding MarR family transcriptional regulator